MTFAAMLLADARLPTGGHAYSSGVEPALRGGLAAERVRELMLGRAVTTSCVEAGTAVVARHLLVPFDTPPSSAAQGAVAVSTEMLIERSRDLGRVERAWAARTPSPALRDASRELARGYRRLARRLWPDSPALAALDAHPRPCRAVVLGAMAVELGLSPEDLARLVIYDEAAGAAAALLKLEPRDPAEVSGWILDACAAAEPHVTGLAALTEPAAIPAASAPQTEEWAQAHATSDRRLFRA
ncbi:urease accessory protein UreF [Gordonia sp. FQ]|uniref:urease accessory protein UreF n=1 Tax=Gordonia sp. FQ TaxID=3446634 RepID=UPI003F869880